MTQPLARYSGAARVLVKETLQKYKQYLLTGVSHVVPFIACGGILIAIAIAGATMSGHGTDTSRIPELQLIADIGVAAFKLSLPVLAGFVAYGMTGRPGLVPGMVGGFLADNIKAGFLGALIAGLLAGHVVELLKKIPVNRIFRPIMPIMVIPICSSVVVGVVMLKIIGVPIAGLMLELSGWLEAMNHGNKVLLGAILGAMIAFDMGGPVNKAAFFFGSAMIQQQNYAIMGACAAAICTPPLGLGLATLIQRKLWTAEQRESGLAALGMGTMGITEGAIPFAAADPVRVIPSIMLGSVVAASLAMLGSVGDQAPHGGLIVLPVIQNRLFYVFAILAGVITTAVCINLLKRFTEKPTAAPATTA